MCKHSAAVLYGVGARLDLQPELLFKLRGVNHEDLVDLKAAISDVTASNKTTHRLIADRKLSKIFDIEFSDEKSNNTIETNSISNKKQANSDFTGIAVCNARKKLKLSYVAFAKKLGVSATTVSRWENRGRAKLKLRKPHAQALNELYNG